MSTKPDPASLTPVAGHGRETPAAGRLAPGYPSARPRRNRKADWSRRLTAESHLAVDDLIWPIFVVDGDNARVPVNTMPGIDRLSIDLAVEAAAKAAGLSIPVIALFPYTDPALRDPRGSEGLNPDNLVCRAVRAIKAQVPDIGILCDVALDPYTSHGHDGVMDEETPHGRILNDETVDILVRQALVQAEAGCDIVAPSDMMDGRIGAIRTALEAEGRDRKSVV